MTPLRFSGVSALVLAATLLPARAQEEPLRGAEPSAGAPAATAAVSGPKVLPETLGDAVGTWDMSLDGSNRRCELSLSGESGPNGRTLRFPAGCRRALPILANAAGWLINGRSIRIVDRNVRPLVEFAPSQDARSLGGKAESGESYSLVPLQIVASLPNPTATASDIASPPAGIPNVGSGREIPGSQPVLRSDVLARPHDPQPDKPQTAEPAPRPDGPAPGVYALDRFNDKDVCRIALEPGPAKAAESSKDAASKDLSPARLLPDCRDAGITIFEPVSWRFASGHLTLKAKRGHVVNLVAAGDGRWRRDPDVGTTFVLRRVEP